MTRISTCIFLIFFIMVIIFNITSADKSNIKRNTRSSTVKIGDSCETFDKSSGICTDKCKDNFYTKKSSTRAERVYIRNNLCRKNIENGYCCSKNDPIVNLGDQCKTYQNKIGTCTTEIKSCQEEIFTKKVLGRREYRIKHDSSCGKPTEKAFCCTTNRNSDTFVDIDSLKLLPSATICGKTNEERIVGGNATGLADYPWMALLKYRKFEDWSITYKCGGSLINDRYVLTAAHCLEYKRKWKFMNEVRLGEWDLSSTNDCIHRTCADQPLDIGVEEKILHKNYNPQLLINDIALLRLNAKVTYTAYIKPVCLPIETELLSRRSYDDIELTVVGWGKTEEKKSSNKKQHVKLRGVTIDKCYKTLKLQIADKLNNQTQLCAGGDGKHDSCTGDSGGPLMHRDLDAYTPNWTIIGIVSFGFKECAKFGKPAVYTRVDGFMPWILKNIHE